jgi:hypothetical protein
MKMTLLVERVRYGEVLKKQKENKDVTASELIYLLPYLTYPGLHEEIPDMPDGPTMVCKSAYCAVLSIGQKKFINAAKYAKTGQPVQHGLTGKDSNHHLSPEVTASLWILEELKPSKRKKCKAAAAKSKKVTP